MSRGHFSSLCHFAMDLQRVCIQNSILDYVAAPAYLSEWLNNDFLHVLLTFEVFLSF
jgi:hypothetical protein